MRGGELTEGRRAGADRTSSPADCCPGALPGIQVWACKSFTKTVPLYVQTVRQKAVDQIRPFLDPGEPQLPKPLTLNPEP